MLSNIVDRIFLVPFFGGFELNRQRQVEFLQFFDVYHLLHPTSNEKRIFFAELLFIKCKSMHQVKLRNKFVDIYYISTYKFCNYATCLDAITPETKFSDRLKNM